jgi:hypothetical protein
MNPVDCVNAPEPPGGVTAEQVIAAANQLAPADRLKVARALAKMELDAELDALISELQAQSPVDDISDEDVLNEVRAVRRQGP